ncbi:hypothetical protein NHX12_002141 [Muraenolepis orangiensis]|uniref:Zona pellucida sperm-binding protein 3 n=1 Tax=Muraenolepis orangiensis TaxID=630683 RepID=A0A9Q0E3I4_9TELE|nr:hypothetical protein NHX12_002141 [Muraenolepis orangiensis]
MTMKWTAVSLVAVATLCHLCNAQYNKPVYNKPNAPQEPVMQYKEPVEGPLLWTYPEDPVDPPKPEAPFVPHSPVPAVTVAVACREMDARVEVKKDMFGTGQLIDAADLTLGSCAALGEDPAMQVVIFETDLHQCDSRLSMSADSLIYSFTLNYNPRAIGNTPVVRTSGAAVTVECHYPRNHNVSSLPLDPIWTPFAATKVSDELLYFDLVIMTDDWKFERPSYQYFLGDMVNIEATVKQYFHVPLRVFVDSCTATMVPDLNATPKYNFIENYGCMVDGLLTGSASKFLPRQKDNTLQFQLEAFRFQASTTGLLYITCNLKATSVAFGCNEWTEMSGDNGVCGSCGNAGGGGGGSWGPSNPMSKGRKTRMASEAQPEVVVWETTIALKPLEIFQRTA